jgi:Tol biopolymer transport system component
VLAVQQRLYIGRYEELAKIAVLHGNLECRLLSLTHVIRGQNMRRLMFAVVVFLLTWALQPTAAQDVPRVTSINALSLSSGASDRVFPSPDARMLAYHSAVRLNSHVDRYFTLSTVEPGDEPDYFDKPEDLPRGIEADSTSFYIPMAWSPDSTRVAAASQPLVTLTDTDLWIFDVASTSWTNLADDAYSGTLTAEAGQPAPAGTIVDTQPSWSPDGAAIAVERTVMGDNGAFGSANIVLIDPETGAEQVLAPVPGTAVSGATTSIDWSADGSSLAVVVRQREPDAENDGLWLLSVATGESRQLVSLSQIEAALHDVYPDLDMTGVGPVTWSPDGTRLLLWAGKIDGTPVLVWPFIVDVDSGEITSAPVPAHPRDTEATRGLRPLQVAWSPDGTQLLMFTFGLHPDEDSTSLDPNNPSVRGALRIANLETGETQLLGYLPLGSTALFFAEWSADGHVIINGYHLVLE